MAFDGKRFDSIVRAILKVRETVGPVIEPPLQLTAIGYNTHDWL